MNSLLSSSSLLAGVVIAFPFVAASPSTFSILSRGERVRGEAGKSELPDLLFSRRDILVFAIILAGFFSNFRGENEARALLACGGRLRFLSLGLAASLGKLG